ncbi:hypothetical protein [Butyrivibrio sp. AD3002]|uniref:hypothetical protein n=1 Tax=Butyrivibrio sp. AD3002 TaxID=1280670 RepID=UPI0003B5904F|nr:hypothetical protein [Butyrivibrio sp. AD3002]
MEYRKKCNVCGKVFCYTDQDLKNNSTARAMTAISAVGTIAAVFGGTRLDAYALDAKTDRESKKIVDYDHCPNCHSTNLTSLSDLDWIAYCKEQQQAVAAASISINSNASVESLITRIEIFLEEGAWKKAEVYCEQALDMDPTNGALYYYKLLAEQKKSTIEAAVIDNSKITEEKNFIFARKYGDSEIQKKLDHAEDVLKKARYDFLIECFKNDQTIENYQLTLEKFISIQPFEDSDMYIEKCRERIIALKAEEHQKEVTDAINELRGAYTAEAANKAWDKIVSIGTPEEVKNSEVEFKNVKESIAKKEKLAKSNVLKVLIAFFIVSILVIFVMTVIKPKIDRQNSYKIAEELSAKGDYATAIEKYELARGYSDSESKIKALSYTLAVEQYKNAQYKEAMDYASKANGYKDADSYYEKANQMYLLTEANLKFALHNYIAGYELLDQITNPTEDANEIYSFYQKYKPYAGKWIATKSEYLSNVSNKWMPYEEELPKGVAEAEFCPFMNIKTREAEFVLIWGNTNNEKDRELQGVVEGNIFSYNQKGGMQCHLTFDLETGVLVNEIDIDLWNDAKYYYSKKE